MNGFVLAGVAIAAFAAGVGARLLPIRAGAAAHGAIPSTSANLPAMPA